MTCAGRGTLRLEGLDLTLDLAELYAGCLSERSQTESSG